MNQVKPQRLRKQNVSLNFNENIDTVYKCFFCLDVLCKIETSNYPFTLIETRNSNNIVSGYSLEWTKPNHFSMKVKYGESKENCNYKTITKYITELNGKTVPSKLANKYHFYSNSSNNSTFFTLEMEYDKLCVNLFY